MTVQNRNAFRASFIVVIAGLSGCAVSQRQPFHSAFLPPAAAPVVARGQITETPPEILVSYLDRETPRALEAASSTPSRPTGVDTRLIRADERFQAGRKLLAAGDADGARREFDRAVDLLLATSNANPDRQAMEKRLEDLVERIHRYDVESLGAGQAESVLPFDKSPLDEILELTFPLDPRLKTKVRDEVQATTSQLPLEVNDAVLSYVNYFSGTRGRRTIQAGLRRAGRYRPLISRILDEEGVPQELIHLAQAESGFMPRAVSRKAATGMWQFVQFRGRQYGLFQSTWHDDRLDPEKATRAAARHLRDLYEQFGDWYLAMAAYNCGPLNVERAVQRTGYADFWQLRERNVLPRETANYVPAILAMIIVVKNAKDYGIDESDPDPAVEYDTIEITAPTHTALIADAADQPVSGIRELNPALLKNLAPAGYALHVPKGSGAAVATALDLVPGLRRNAWRLHRLGEGETLASVARQFRTTAASLENANQNLGVAPQAGDLVVVPAAPPPEPKVARKGSAARRGTAARSTAAKRATAAGAQTTAKRKPAAKAAAPLAGHKPASGTTRVAQAATKRGTTVRR